MLLPLITRQSIVYRCINQLLFMQFYDGGYILGATVAHFYCVFIKYFVKLIGGWEVVTQQLQKSFCNICGDCSAERRIKGTLMQIWKSSFMFLFI